MERISRENYLSILTWNFSRLLKRNWSRSKTNNINKFWKRRLWGITRQKKIIWIYKRKISKRKKDIRFSRWNSKCKRIWKNSR